jgi:hypothetical protein
MCNPESDDCKEFTVDVDAAVEELTANPAKAKAVETALVNTVRDTVLRLYRECNSPAILLTSSSSINQQQPPTEIKGSIVQNVQRIELPRAVQESAARIFLRPLLGNETIYAEIHDGAVLYYSAAEDDMPLLLGSETEELLQARVNNIGAEGTLSVQVPSAEAVADQIGERLREEGIDPDSLVPVGGDGLEVGRGSNLFVAFDSLKPAHVSEVRTLLSVEDATQLLAKAGETLAENEAVVQYGDQPWIVSIKDNIETRVRRIGDKREGADMTLIVDTTGCDLSPVIDPEAAAKGEIRSPKLPNHGVSGYHVGKDTPLLPGAGEPINIDSLQQLIEPGENTTTAKEVSDVQVKIEETMAFKMAKQLGIEMQDLTIRDPNAMDKVDVKFVDHPLVAGVTRLFQFCNHPRPDEWLIDLDEEYVSDPRIVQVLLTHHLHRHLSRLEIHEAKPSIQIRQVLTPDDKLSNWLVMLELVVIPFMIDQDLPMGMSGRDPEAPVAPAARLGGAAEPEAPVGDLDHVRDTPDAVPAELAESNLSYDNLRRDDHAVIDPEILKNESTPTVVAYFGGYPMENEALRYLDLNNVTPEISEAMVAECLVTPKYFASVVVGAQNRQLLADVMNLAINRGGKVPVPGWGAGSDSSDVFTIGNFELDNEELRHVDPWDPELSIELKKAAIKEATDNPVYFLAIMLAPGKDLKAAYNFIVEKDGDEAAEQDGPATEA